MVVLAVVAVIAARLTPAEAPLTGTGRAVDGDTLKLGERRIRLTGLDAPELDQSCKNSEGSNWACGREARAELARVLNSGALACHFSGLDKYGRTLATCTAGGNDVAARVVLAGLAIATDSYWAEERAARDAKRGIWSGTFVAPPDWRESGAQRSWFDIVRGWITGR